jgi:hypothetical protein
MNQTLNIKSLGITLKIQMIFCHKPYYNPNYTNLNKKNLSDICLKPKNIYKIHKLYNAKQKKLKRT